MTVAIPLTVQIDYSELKYSLRSIEKYLQQPYEVVIIGNVIPDWITNITQISLPDVPGKKQFSIRRKILAALEYADEILFLNDDLYFLQPATEFHYYWHGMLKNYSETGTRQVEKQLQAQGRPVKHGDGHYALVYERDKFREASENFTEDCIIKSMYINYHNIEGVFAPDCKLLRKMKPEQIKDFIKDKPCFSTGIYSIESALPILQELFPLASKYEI